MTSVKTPSLEAMLGDKLTAFAPNTIGIRYEDMKLTEVIKQLYDCSRLFRVSKDFKLVRHTYLEISAREIKYRQLIDITSGNCLDDTIDTCKLILSDGKSGVAANYILLKRGILGFGNFVLGRFGLHDAIVCAMDVYICCVILKCGGKEEFLNLLVNVNANNVRAPFLSKTQIRQLMIVSGPIYNDFLKAVWVENQLIS